jgi:hypothetical protein
MYTVTTDNTRITQFQPQSHWSGIVDKVPLVYDYLFSSEDSIIEKNKYAILFVQNAVQNEDFVTIEKFLNDSSLSDLDISILYSISIISRQFSQLNDYTTILDNLIASQV